MNRRSFLRNAALLSGGLMLGCNRSFATAGKTKPTEVLIFSDDQRFDTIAALGNPHIVTPNLDCLAKRSFVFNNAYCFGGNTGAVCIPSRNMVMSGRTFLRFEADVRKLKAEGKKTRRTCYANPDWPTFPKSMKAAGYETYFYEKSGSVNNPVIRTQFDHYKDANMVELLKTGRPAEPVIAETIDFLKHKRDKSKPFFLYLGLPCPHDPRWSTQQFRDLYDPEKLPLPPNYRPVHPYDIGDMTVRDECLEAWPRTEKAIKKHLHDYYSLISSMDYDIGTLLDALDEMDLTDDTLIIFSSDQGIAIGSHGLMGKQNIYEDTMKVPLLFAGPGIKKGQTDAFAYLHDIYPTVCDMAGADIPAGLDGKSLAPVIHRKQHAVRDEVLLGYRTTQRSVRDDRFKLMCFPEINKIMLFDLKKDPRETTDLSAKPEYADKIKEMTDKLSRLQKVYGDEVPLHTDHPKPATFDAPKKKMKTPYPAGGLAPNPKK